MRPARAVVINLARRPDRLQAFTPRWSALGLDIPLDVYTGVDTGGDEGCLRSHCAVLTAGYAQPLLVLEDDALFAAEFTADLNPPKDWDLLWLGAFHRFPPQPVTGVWHRPVSTLATHAYIVRDPAQLAAAMKDATAMRNPHGRGSAISLSPLTQYVHVPHLVGQAAGFSDIAGRLYPQDRFWQPPGVDTAI